MAALPKFGLLGLRQKLASSPGSGEGRTSANRPEGISTMPTKAVLPIDQTKSQIDQQVSP